jgi:hypothetical protein
MSTPYRPRHRRYKAVGGSQPPACPGYRHPDPSRGLTGSPTGPDILFLALVCATLLGAALCLGGLLASPFSPLG